MLRLFVLMLTAGIAFAQTGLPRYEPDPYWPKPLPNNWMLGEVSGVAIDSHDHVWIIHRPRTLTEHDKYGAEGKADCCVPAPPVIEFDQAGNTSGRTANTASGWMRRTTCGWAATATRTHTS